MWNINENSLASLEFVEIQQREGFNGQQSVKQSLNQTKVDITELMQPDERGKIELNLSLSVSYIDISDDI
jgi:hypothetical protein